MNTTYGDLTPIAAYRLADLVRIGQSQLETIKRAYHTGEPGWTYDDMKAAAKRLLAMRRMYERATERPVTSNPDSTAQIAALLR